MILRGGSWLDPGGRWQVGDLRLQGGRIVTLGAVAGDIDDEILDARGLRIVPGAIDPHVHLRAPGQSVKEGVDRGSRAALAGGVTTVLDMPNNRPPTSTPARLERKRQLFRRQCRCHWGLFGQATPRGPRFDPRRVPALKLYMATSSALPAVVDDEDLRRVLASAPLVAVHAEDERGFGPGATHGERRPRSAVVRALDGLERALFALPESRRPRLVLCHTNIVEELAWLRRLKALGLDLWGETCPHYLTFTDDDVRHQGARLQVNPPIRQARDRAALRAALADGTLDFVATDHAPHRPAEKASANPPSGIAGVEWLLPFAAQLVDEGLLTWRRLVEVCAASAAACYRIPDRGHLEVGAVADLALLSPRARTRPRAAPITGAGWTPYDDTPFAWAVHATVVAGQIAYLDGAWPDGVRGEELYP